MLLASPVTHSRSSLRAASCVPLRNPLRIRAVGAGPLSTSWTGVTLLAAIGDVAHPSWRASAVGVYRPWRGLGYAVGALLAGITADALGVSAAMWLVAAITFASGVVVAVRMRATRRAAR